MVAKSISMSDETYEKVKKISELSGAGFSKTAELLIKRGIAYSLILDKESKQMKLEARQ